MYQKCTMLKSALFPLVQFGCFFGKLLRENVPNVHQTGIFLGGLFLPESVPNVYQECTNKSTFLAVESQRHYKHKVLGGSG